MEKLAWLAWHILLPWRKKGDRSTPLDLLGRSDRKPAKEITKEEARARLAELEAEFRAIE